MMARAKVAVIGLLALVKEVPAVVQGAVTAAVLAVATSAPALATPPSIDYSAAFTAAS